MTDRELMQQALEALENFARFQRMMMDGPDVSDKLLAEDYAEAGFLQGAKTITALRERLADSPVNESLTTGSCIACGNRMTGSSESFVVATAEVGVTAPEGYSPQQVGALHPHKVGDKTAPPLVNRIADILVEDHMRLAQPEQEPVAEVKLKMTGGNAGIATHIVEIYDPLRDRLHPGTKLYTAPPRREWVGLTDEEIMEPWPFENRVAFARWLEAKLKEKNT